MYNLEVFISKFWNFWNYMSIKETWMNYIGSSPPKVQIYATHTFIFDLTRVRYHAHTHTLSRIFVDDCLCRRETCVSSDAKTKLYILWECKFYVSRLLRHQHTRAQGQSVIYFRTQETCYRPELNHAWFKFLLWSPLNTRS